MTKSRILLVTPDYPPLTGGVAQYLSRLAHHFADRLVVWTDVEGAEQATPNIVVQRRLLLFKRMWPAWLATTISLVRARHEYDLVLVSHLVPFGTAAWLASWITRKPYLILCHGMDIRLIKQSPWKSWMVKFILAASRLVVANSQALAQEIALQWNQPLPLVVYPCIDSIDPLEQKLSTEPLRLLTVSRLVARKGHLLIMMALSKLRDEGRLPPLQYDIVGEGPMRSSIEQLIQQLHLPGVVLHGAVSQDELKMFYANAHVFVMPVLDDPIDKEGFGFVFLEAASAGVPSITTTVSGVDEAVIDRETGRCVPPGDVDALSEALAELLSDASLRQKYGVQAYERAKTHFLCDAQFSTLEPFL